MLQARPFMGPFTYRAPEELMGLPSGLPADIFSLGVVMYGMITHELPRRGHMR